MSTIKPASRTKPCPVEDTDAKEIESMDAPVGADQEEEEEAGHPQDECQAGEQEEVQEDAQEAAQQEVQEDAMDEIPNEAQEDAQEPPAVHDAQGAGDADEPAEEAIAECDANDPGQEDAAIPDEDAGGDAVADDDNANDVAPGDDANAPAEGGAGEDDADAGGNATEGAPVHDADAEDGDDEKMWDPTEPGEHVQVPVAERPTAKAKATSRPSTKASATQHVGTKTGARKAKPVAPKKKRKGAPGARKRVRAIHSDSEPEPSDGEDIGDGMNDDADAEDDIELDPEEARKMAEFIAPESEEEEADDAETEAGDPLRVESDDEEVERIAQATKERYAKMVAQEKSTLAAQAARKAAAAARIDQTLKASTAKPKAATHVSSAPAKTKPARAPVATDGDDEVVVAVAPKSKKAAVATTQSAPKGTTASRAPVAPVPASRAAPKVAFQDPRDDAVVADDEGDGAGGASGVARAKGTGGTKRKQGEPARKTPKSARKAADVSVHADAPAADEPDAEPVADPKAMAKDFVRRPLIAALGANAVPSGPAARQRLIAHMTSLAKATKTAVFAVLNATLVAKAILWSFEACSLNTFAAYCPDKDETKEWSRRAKILVGGTVIPGPFVAGVPGFPGESNSCGAMWTFLSNAPSHTASLDRILVQSLNARKEKFVKLDAFPRPLGKASATGAKVQPSKGVIPFEPGVMGHAFTEFGWIPRANAMMQPFAFGEWLGGNIAGSPVQRVRYSSNYAPKPAAGPRAKKVPSLLSSTILVLPVCPHGQTWEIEVPEGGDVADPSARGPRTRKVASLCGSVLYAVNLAPAAMAYTLSHECAGGAGCGCVVFVSWTQVVAGIIEQDASLAEKYAEMQRWLQMDQDKSASMVPGAGGIACADDCLPRHAGAEAGWGMTNTLQTLRISPIHYKDFATTVNSERNHASESANQSTITADGKLSHPIVKRHKPNDATAPSAVPAALPSVSTGARPPPAGTTAPIAPRRSTEAVPTVAQTGKAPVVAPPATRKVTPPGSTATAAGNPPAKPATTPAPKPAASAPPGGQSVARVPGAKVPTPTKPTAAAAAAPKAQPSAKAPSAAAAAAAKTASQPPAPKAPPAVQRAPTPGKTAPAKKATPAAAPVRTTGAPVPDVQPKTAAATGAAPAKQPSAKPAAPASGPRVVSSQAAVIARTLAAQGAAAAGPPGAPVSRPVPAQAHPATDPVPRAASPSTLGVPPLSVPAVTAPLQRDAIDELVDSALGMEQNDADEATFAMLRQMEKESLLSTLSALEGEPALAVAAPPANPTPTGEDAIMSATTAEDADPGAGMEAEVEAEVEVAAAADAAASTAPGVGEAPPATPHPRAEELEKLAQFECSRVMIRIPLDSDDPAKADETVETVLDVYRQLCDMLDKRCPDGYVPIDCDVHAICAETGAVVEMQARAYVVNGTSHKFVRSADMKDYPSGVGILLGASRAPFNGDGRGMYAMADSNVPRFGKSLMESMRSNGIDFAVTFLKDIAYTCKQ